jgi:branched-chain amino acid transport system permease protein
MLRNWRQRVTITDILVWGIGVAIGVVVIVGTIATLRSGKYSPATWLDLTVKGLALGGVYALIAMGYTLVYGILRMINFAHSEVFMSGPFTAVFLANALARSGFLERQPVISMILVTILSMAVSMTIALLLERIAYRPLRNAPRLVPLITAIGASFFLQ